MSPCQADARRTLCSILSANYTAFAVWIPKEIYRISRPLRPVLDPPEIVVLFLGPERAFCRSRPHSGKFLSDKVFLLFLLTERTVDSQSAAQLAHHRIALLDPIPHQFRVSRITHIALIVRSICVHRVQILHVRSRLVGEYALKLLYLQVPSLCRPTACSSSIAVSDLLSRRRISGSGCCRSAVPAVSDNRVQCTSS